MANELLDFVMSLARDPDVAARYAADPAQTLADAHLAGVTSADVSNLLPMVSDSLSMTSPAAGSASTVGGNVWTSGAATAAFDAFTPHAAVPTTGQASVIDVGHSAISDPGAILQPVDHDPAGAAGMASTQLSDLHGGESSFGDGGTAAAWDDWSHVTPDAHDGSDVHDGLDHGHQGFDIHH